MRKSGNKREIVLISGKSTYGKSNFASDRLYVYNRVVIFDPESEHDGKFLPHVADVERHCYKNPIYRVTTDKILEFEDLCEWLIHTARPEHRIMFAIEELTRLNLDPQLRKFPHFRQIVFAGGHSGIDLMIIAQRISSIPISLRSQYTEIDTFCQTEPDDLQYFKSVSQDEIMRTIPLLDPREYIQITNRKVERLRS